MPPAPHHERRFIEPKWPEGQFNLRAIGGGFEIGPFTRDGFSVSDDGTLYFSDDSGAHPVTLRVRRQDGDAIDANNGDTEPMRYRIVPLDVNGEPQSANNQIRALDALLSNMSDSELARAWARCMRHLRERDLVRTANTPVGDYAERICCERFGLERLGFSEKGIDAIGPGDRRYQIKARRLTPENPSRQLGAIRDIDQQPFDELLAVFFDEDLELQEIWRIPHEVVAEAKFVSRTNSTRFVLTPKVQHDPRVERLV